MPKRTIELLKFLSDAGFSDEDLRIIHHKPEITIKQHLEYCEGIEKFMNEDSKNVMVRDRLETIMREYERGGFTEPSKQGDF